ncbi:hypothetical protein CTAYLR_005461 [Chrysophaeum taylorii]|uniref:N(6)-L-threonylcarbamoyladenine synthase n=1 Tax=Chrysophaeum taylorii TaxID=2483200 RepID=A0AAD7XPX3_9STRA|nr:hypothetical protein CTAYLR_005461 [Chrysophaeum taylorii]
MRMMVVVTALLPRTTGFSAAAVRTTARKHARRCVTARAERVGKPKAMYRPTSPSYPLTEMDEPRALSGLPDRSRPFTVLGIETSCDDTAAAIVRSDGTIVAEAIMPQHEVHAKFGGVVPSLAKEAHQEAIEAVVAQVLQRAGLESARELDAISATVGPGLEICLRVGARKAAQLASDFELPFVGCHHLEGHCLVARLAEPCRFPFLSLCVSGGHSMIVKCEGVGRYQVLGGTLDDALGEAYDKAARMLGLDMKGGGGPELERVAREGNPTSVPLPVPMKKRKDCDFSYAGLKTALKLQIEKKRHDAGLVDEEEPLPDQDVADLAASFQHVAITHLEDRLAYAFDRVRADDAFQSDQGRPQLALVGGVASNAEVRRRVSLLCDRAGWDLVVPPPKLCTDNGVMIAWAAIEKLHLGFSDAIDDEVYPRWPFRPPASVAAPALP